MSSSPFAQNLRDGDSLILFDGVCNLCNGTVNFIIDRDPAGRFRFAPLQSDVARPYLDACGIPADTLESVVLIEDGRAWTRSDAALRIVRRLGGGWPLLYGFTVVPRSIRDAVYRWIAGNRYRWFGRQEACRIPTPKLRARFL